MNTHKLEQEQGETCRKCSLKCVPRCDQSRLKQCRECRLNRKIDVDYHNYHDIVNFMSVFCIRADSSEPPTDRGIW